MKSEPNIFLIVNWRMPNWEALETKSLTRDKLLGINRDMGREEIRKLLNKQFRTWQGRQGSNDAAVREKAQERLDMIAEARNRHLS